MRKCTHFISVLSFLVAASVSIANAQIGVIQSYAAMSACNVTVDNAGKVYTTPGNVVYKVDSGAVTTIVAGGGTSYGDGGPATNAKLNNAVKVVFDASENMYIADNGYGVIRKVNTSGIISTVAGNYSLGGGYTGDGGPATAAKLQCDYICMDAAANLYIADATDHVVRKVNAAGIITTIAGNGSVTYTGDGGPATNAGLAVGGWGNNNFSIAADIAGNLYITDGSNYRVRRVNAAGIITTVAGNGKTGAHGAGGPATAASVYFPQGLATDIAGNLYISEWQNCVIAGVNTAGIYNTIAGNYSISFSGDGGPATAAGLNAESDVAIDPFGNVYIADCHNNRIRKVYGVAAWGGIFSPTDSFTTWTTKSCNGPQLTTVTRSYTAGMYVKTDFGDGTTDSSVILPGFTVGGAVAINHSYNAAGTFTINQILYKSGVPIDTFTTPYTYTFCRSLPLKMFFDVDGDCLKGASEAYLSQPTTTEVDSNGVPVDTISATSGFNYSAYCIPGDTYSFKVLTKPGDLVVSCPATGIIKDTVFPSVATYPDKMFGLSCPTKTSFDFGLNTIVPVTGVNDQWGDIYITNTACLGAGGTVTLTFSPKWTFGVSDARPAAASVTATSATWNIAAISGSDPKPLDIYYVLWSNPITGKLTVRDTVHSRFVVTPFAGDMDTTNNTQVRDDTIRAGCDPNEMFVSPEGNVLSCTPLKYTINFENTGNDTAHNIYVMDTLSDNVDPNSLRIIMATAEMNITKLKDGGHTIIRFDFPQINLLDSSHHGFCDGSVIFTVNSRTGLSDGTAIFNHAGIFFDYNDVVMTDTVENIIGIQPITGAGSVCFSVTDTLVDATTGGVWSASNAHASVLNGVVTGITAGIDTISYTVTSSCSSETQTKIMTIGAVVAGTITGPSNICNGATAALSDGAGGGVWSSSNTAIATITSSGSVSGLASGLVAISYTVTNSCGTALAALPFTVNPLPAIYPVAGGGSMCSGDTGVHVGISNSELSAHYQLYNGSSTVGGLIAGISAALDMGLQTAAGTYTVQAINTATTCTSNMAGSATISVIPSVTPSVSITADADTVCVGKTVALTAIPVNGGSSPGYLWSVNSIAAGAGSSYTYTPAAGDIISATLISSATCAKPNTAIQSFAMTVLPLLKPVVSVSASPGATISSGEMATLTAAATSAGTTPTYQWTINSVTIPGATLSTYTSNTFSEGNVVSCSVTSGGECGGYTASNAVTIHISHLGINSLQHNNNYSIFPNPTTDELTIKTDQNAYNSFTITNSIGQIMMQQQLHAATTTISVKTLPAGLYYISLSGDSGVKVQKFVKM